MKENNKYSESDESEDETTEDISDVESDDYEDMKSIQSLELGELKKFFSQFELCHYKQLSSFYKALDEKKITKMIEIIKGTSDISLRILDWFVTKSQIKNNALKISYRARLKGLRKRYFDPFRRGKKKFVWEFSKDKRIYTTLGQMIFFQWGFETSSDGVSAFEKKKGKEDFVNIIDHIDTNLDDIIKSMNVSNKKEKQEKIKTKEKKLSNTKNVVNNFVCNDDYMIIID